MPQTTRLRSVLPTLFAVLLKTIDLPRRASWLSALTVLGLLFLGVALPTATVAQQLDSPTSSADATARDENGSVEKNDLPESAPSVVD